MSRLRIFTGLALTVGLLLGACTTEASPTPSSTAANLPSASGPAASMPAVQNSTLTLANSPELGAYLTDESGMTLYHRTTDGPNASTCADDCASTWPPLTLDAGAQILAGAGVTGVLSTFTRADGGLQVSYNGQPLYFYSGDATVGDANGQGFDGIWFVAPAAADSSAAPTTVGGISY